MTPSPRTHQRILTINLVIAIGGTILLTTFLALYLAQNYASRMGAKREHMRVQTSVIASRTEVLMGEIALAMETFDAWMRNHPDEDPRYASEFADLVDAFLKRTDNRVHVRIIDASGDLYNLPAVKAESLANVSDREYFHVAAAETDSDVLTFNSPVQSRLSGEWFIPITHRLAKNRFGLLAILAGIYFPVFDDSVADVFSDPAMSASIIRDDRTVLVRSPVNWDLIGNKLEFHPEEAGYEVITVTSQALVKTDQGRRAVYSQRLDGFPLYVLLADSEIRVTQDWLREVAVPGSLFLLLIAAFVTLNVKLIALNRQNADIQAKLEVAARYDLLTGLRNRPYFYERTQEEMSRSTRTNQSIVMLGADIDHFKAVNDTYGHQAGDEILKRIAAVIDQNIRTVDVSGRIGGEEFSVLLTNANLAAGREIAERIRRETESISFGEWKGGISIGVAQWWGERESIERLFARADEALYRAKNAGRNRVEVDWRTSEGSETLSG